MTFSGDSSPRDLTDRILRQSLRRPENLRAFLRQAVPTLADGFDCDHARLLDREFATEDWRRREADLPFEIPYRTAAGPLLALVFVLIEHQTDTDPLMPLRLLYFLALYWDRQWRQWESLPRPKPPLRLNPVLPLVLYTGPTPWGSNRTIADLLGEPRAFHVFAPDWGPLFWNLAERTPQELLAAGDEWLQVLAVLRAQGEEATAFEAIYTAALRGVNALPEAAQDRWDELMRILLTWAAHRRPAPERARLLALAPTAPTLPKRQQEVQAMTMTIAEAWAAEGELRGAQRFLQRLLTKKFGPLPEPIAQRIQAATDLERLHACAEQLFEIQSLDELKL